MSGFSASSSATQVVSSACNHDVRTVRGLIERAAARSPDGVYALTLAADGEPGRALRHAELAERLRSVRAALRNSGIGRGDTVAVVMANGLGTLEVLLGVMSMGAIVCPVNLLAQPAQMRYVLDHSDCKLVVTSASWRATIDEMLADVSRPIALWTVEPDGSPLNGHGSSSTLNVTDEPEPLPDAVALLMYTSGTTGVPKGVMLTHAALVANAIAVSREHALTGDDRVLAVLPLYHINAFVVTMLAPLVEAGGLAMPPKFSAANMWRQAQAGGCTWLNVVPTMVSYLLEGDTPPPDQTARLRFARSASAALPPEHLSAFERRFGLGVIETMGLTETAAPSFSNPLDPSARKLGAVGRASGCEARVVDAGLQPVPDGVTGELVIRGPHLMRGYYKNDEATRSSFTPDGWLRTGDLGHRDADGFFFVTGRIKELIIKGGENIAPREIDEVLLQHPGVLEAAAVGVPDRHYGQEILACIVPRDASSDAKALQDDLRAFCEERLGRYKTPREFRLVESLPRGPSGKVQRLKLLDML